MKKDGETWDAARSLGLWLGWKEYGLLSALQGRQNHLSPFWVFSWDANKEINEKNSLLTHVTHYMKETLTKKVTRRGGLELLLT